MSRGLEAASHVAHLAGEVQRFGYLSAASVVKRYTEIVDRAIAGTAGLPEPGTPARGAEGEALLDGASRLVEAGATSFEAMTALLLESLRPDTGTRGLETVLLPPAARGSTCRGSLWLHNATATPVTEVDLRATGLSSSSGGLIPADAVTLSPTRLEILAAVSHHEVAVHVTVPRKQAPGHYHGLVVLSAAPEEAIALLLEVRAITGEP